MTKIKGFLKATIKKECADTGKEEDAVAIVDPPRAGMMEKVTRKLMEFRLKNIVYVSCNPKTLIADLKILISEYSIKKISIADQFTNTAYAECVVLLSRKK